MRQYTGIDKLINSFDQALRSLVPGATSAQRTNPSNDTETKLAVSEARHVAGLMRVNHTGEVCAQALYHGQALTAKLPNVRREMEFAAIEEQDHLAWCEDRLKELDSH
ncbi:MAG: demethoxyubiquinone hydroxylase family protein, partial [Acinetobacter sp.]